MEGTSGKITRGATLMLFKTRSARVAGKPVSTRLMELGQPHLSFTVLPIWSRLQVLPDEKVDGDMAHNE